MNPCVSVIIPVYNAEKYLQECLESVCSQTLQDIEIICVNDGSTDKSAEILTEYAETDGRIKIISQENAGAGAARNRGMEIARGDYLAFIDSDDFWKPPLLETAYSQIKRFDADLCLYPFAVYDEQTGKISETEYAGWLPGKQLFTPKDYRNRIFQMAAPGPGFCLYRRKYINNSGLNFLQQHVAEDIYFIFLSLAFASKICYIRDVNAIVRRGMKGNLSSALWKYPRETHRSLLLIKQRLEEAGLFDVYRKSFRTSAISSSEYVFWIVPEDILPKEERLKMLEELDITDKSAIVEYQGGLGKKNRSGKLYTLYRMIKIYGFEYTCRYMFGRYK